MSINEENIIIKNIFTDNEINSIYDVVKLNENRSEIVAVYSQKAYHCQMPENIISKITNIAKATIKENIVLSEISFASYSKKYGDMPLLSPHFDNTFKEKRFTLDVQLKSNISWPIFVSGKAFTLNDNEALMRACSLRKS